jgi:Tfp pilus assembly protein PilF
LTAYDLYLQALSFWGSLEKEGNLRALALLDCAIQRDPHYGPALSLAAHCRQALAANDWVDDVDANRREAIDLARRALRFAPDDPDVLAFAGFTLGVFGEDIAAAIGLVDHALTINPSFARGWQWSGVLRNFAGEPDIAIEHLERSLRLSPRDRTSSGPGLGSAYFFSRRFDEAASILLSALQRAPRFAVTYRLLASCYAHMGRLDEARDIVTPVVVPSLILYRKPEYCELFLSGRVWRRARHDHPLRSPWMTEELDAFRDQFRRFLAKELAPKCRKMAAGQDRRPCSLARARRYRRVATERAGGLWRAGHQLCL